MGAQRRIHSEIGRARPIAFAPVEEAPVVIEDDADVAIGSVLLPGVRMGRVAQVGAGAVVTRDVPPYMRSSPECRLGSSATDLSERRGRVDSMVRQPATEVTTQPSRHPRRRSVA